MSAMDCERVSSPGDDMFRHLTSSIRLEFDRRKPRQRGIAVEGHVVAACCVHSLKSLPLVFLRTSLK
jgi:hypothetical protein